MRSLPKSAVGLALDLPGGAWGVWSSRDALMRTIADLKKQGWQNVGTANASPVTTRRYAFIVDRSAINADPTSRYLKTVVVPNN